MIEVIHWFEVEVLDECEASKALACRPAIDLRCYTLDGANAILVGYPPAIMSTLARFPAAFRETGPPKFVAVEVQS